MAEIRPAQGVHFADHVGVLIVGAGAAGLTAALAAAEGGDDILLLERDAAPQGSTALSSGFVPAPGTRYQSPGDSPDLFAADIARKAKGWQDARLARLAADTIGPVIDWLGEGHGLDWQVLDSFLYPGHSHHRMHAVPERTGQGLMTRLQAAVAAVGVPVATQARVEVLFVEGGRIAGVELARPDGARERIGCRALVLACNGYGGNADLVAQHLPEMSEALYFGHVGNRGEAVLWGEALGAAVQHLSGYQGHGSVAVPQGALITWALMMEGGIQVNRAGTRFSNEHGGYSEQAVHVLAQPDGRAWCVFDERLHALGLGFPDYAGAVQAGALRTADKARDLAAHTGIDAEGLAATLADVAQMQRGAASDPFGRDFTGQPALEPPLHAIEVTGALFHTQGGLVIDARARVLRHDGSAFDNLFAAGGAACGVSGPDVSGYLSGNGLLTAFAFGALAGRHAWQV